MNIKLKNGGQLDFRNDFKLSITLNNPMLTEQGSMSIPVPLPLSHNNRRLLGFPDLWNKTNKQKTVFDAQIEAGVYQKPALLRLTSPPGKGTDATLYLNESEMYAKMKEVELSQAFNIIRPESDFQVQGTYDEPIDRIIKYMELVMMGNIQEDFYIFPVATDSYSTTIEEKEYTFYQLLNEPMTVGRGLPEVYVYDYTPDARLYHVLAARKARQYYEDSNWVDVPKGYGITPFLKKNYILHHIFEYFGYQLRESIFDTDPEMQKLVEINNTADAIVKGSLDYSQLVPSGTINDYLDTVRKDYGCEFFISPDHKYVEMKFWNDLIDNKNYIQLDGKLAGEALPTYTDSKLIKLTARRNIEYTSVNFDTLEKFERNYGILTYIDQMPPRGEDSLADGFYFVQNKGDIWEKYTTTRGEGSTLRAWRYHSKYIFDYYEEKEDANYEAIESNREYITNVSCYVKYSEGTGGDVYFSPGYLESLSFIGKRRHMNTVVKKVTTGANDEIEYIDQKPDNTECPVMTAFCRGDKLRYFNGIQAYLVYGNTIKYDYEGNPIEGGFDLVYGGPNGLYNKFWKKYADIIRHSFNQIAIPLHFDIRDIMAFRFDNIYMLDNQPLIPEKLEFSIDTLDRIKINNALFRTIRLYKDV